MRTRFALVAAMAAVVALLALGSGVASAAPECPGVAVRIDGVGSSLQRVAQESIWRPGYTGTGLCTEVTLTYEPLGSGQGLREWSAEAGVAGAAEASGREFIATDDAPTEAQVRNMRRAGNEAGIAIIPVASAAISVIVSRPTGCTITQITNADLQAIFRGTLTNWERVSGVSGGASCNVAIRRVVRRDVSGTTFQFKHYLWLIRSEENVIGTRSWLRLQGAETPADNQEWPNRASVIIPAATGGGAVVTTVEANSGSIGYASITDSFGRTPTILRVLNEEIFAEPTVSGRESNCNVPYITRLGEVGGSPLTREQVTLALLWDRIYGSNPAVGGTLYPICTLTWIGAYLEYATARFAANTGRTVSRYLRYILIEGQASLGERHYGRLPTAILEGARTIAGGVR
jgi:ABC-type phosphate transport system substrate-binding protein